MTLRMIVQISYVLHVNNINKFVLSCVFLLIFYLNYAMPTINNNEINSNSNEINIFKITIATHDFHFVLF